MIKKYHYRLIYNPMILYKIKFIRIHAKNIYSSIRKTIKSLLKHIRQYPKNGLIYLFINWIIYFGIVITTEIIEITSIIAYCYMY